MYELASTLLSDLPVNSIVGNFLLLRATGEVERFVAAAAAAANDGNVASEELNGRSLGFVLINVCM